MKTLFFNLWQNRVGFFLSIQLFNFVNQETRPSLTITFQLFLVLMSSHVSAGNQHAAVMLKALIFIMAAWGVQGCSKTESCPTLPPNATSKDFCYSARIRSTVLQGLPFGGVPTVLALDFMCFLVSRPFSQKKKSFASGWEQAQTVGLVLCWLFFSAFLLEGAAVLVLHSEKRSMGLWAPGTGQRCRQVIIVNVKANSH